MRLTSYEKDRLRRQKINNSPCPSVQTVLVMLKHFSFSTTSTPFRLTGLHSGAPRLGTHTVAEAFSSCNTVLLGLVGLVTIARPG